MREILFKGKTVKGEWVYGLLSHVGNGWYISDEYGNPLAYEVIPSTIGQYTGLTDKNGRRIFEGDICKIFDLVYKVEFKYPGWQLTILSRTAYCYPEFNSHCGEYCEVIGNIHDNPELRFKGGDPHDQKTLCKARDVPRSTKKRCGRNCADGKRYSIV